MLRSIEHTHLVLLDKGLEIYDNRTRVLESGTVPFEVAGLFFRLGFVIEGGV
jgi:hypothetical protein